MSTYQGTGSTGSRKCYHPTRSYRQNTALERLAQRALRSPEEQLAKLDVSLGINRGALKERNRLSQQISLTAQAKESKVIVEQQVSPSDPTPEVSETKSRTTSKAKKSKKKSKEN